MVYKIIIEQSDTKEGHEQFVRFDFESLGELRTFLANGYLNKAILVDLWGSEEEKATKARLEQMARNYAEYNAKQSDGRKKK
jgi:hypothetical protein